MANENLLWLLVENGKETGPFAYSQLQRRYAVHEINGDTQAIPKTTFGIRGWQRLNYYFPNFRGGNEWPVGGAVDPRPVIASGISGTSVESSEAEALLQTVIANQQEQIRLLSLIRWAIVGFSIWFIVQFWLLPKLRG